MLYRQLLDADTDVEADADGASDVSTSADELAGLSPLQIAVRGGDKDFHRFLGAAAKQEIEDIVWETVLYNRADVLKAVFFPSKMFGRPFLSPTKVNDLNDDGNTLLIEAVRCNNVNAVRVLCALEETDVNLECNGNSALRLAARRGYVEIVRVLMWHDRTDVYAVDKVHSVNLFNFVHMLDRRVK